MRILLCSALYREIRPIARSFLPKRPKGRDRRYYAEYLGHDVCLLETGMGAGNMAASLHPTIDGFAPDLIVSLGYCGGLTSRVGIGEVVRASSVGLLTANGIVDTIPLPPATSLFRGLSGEAGTVSAAFLTMRTWMEKGAAAVLIPQDLPSPVCDMETFYVAAIARDRDLPFIAIRAVSDGHLDSIGFDPLCLGDASGFYSPVKAVAFLARRPALLRRAMKLRRSSRLASVNLARAVGLLFCSPDLDIPSWSDVRYR